MKKLILLNRPAIFVVAVTTVWIAPMTQARAHEPPKTGVTTPAKEAAVPTRLEQANTIMGSEVYDARGYPIGRVSQVLLGREFNRVALTLITSNKDPKEQFPVPVTAFRRDAVSRLTIDVMATDLSRVPKVESGDWLALTNAGFLEKIDFFFKGRSDLYKEAAKLNEPPVLGAREDTGMMKPKVTSYQKLTKLIGLGIRARDADMAGNLEDLVVDLTDGKVVYGVLSLNPPGESEMLVAVPWTAIEVRPRQRQANVDATIATLHSLAFLPTSLPDLQDRTFASRIYQAFGREPYWQVYGYAPREADRKAGWLVGSAFNRSFDLKKAKSYVGLVDSVGTFVPETGAADGLRLRVRIEPGEFITVFVGPKAYTDRKRLDLHQGSEVTFTGCEATLDGRSVIVASEVQAGGQIYRVRDGNGQPLWRPTDVE